MATRRVPPRLAWAHDSAATVNMIPVAKTAAANADNAER